MSDEPLKPTPDTSKSEAKKPAEIREAQARQAKDGQAVALCQTVVRKIRALDKP